MTTPTIKVTVLAFARIRELLRFSQRSIEVDEGASIRDVWTTLSAGNGDLAALRASTRFARNGVVATDEERLLEGDEVALLPPVGGG